MRGFRDSAVNKDRRDQAFERAVIAATPQTIYWLAVRFYPNAEVKRLDYLSATERALAFISLNSMHVEIIGQGEGVSDGVW